MPNNPVLKNPERKKLPGSGHLAYSKGVFRGKGLKIVAACADREAAPKGKKTSW